MSGLIRSQGYNKEYYQAMKLYEVSISDQSRQETFYYMVSCDAVEQANKLARELCKEEFTLSETGILVIGSELRQCKSNKAIWFQRLDCWDR